MDKIERYKQAINKAKEKLWIDIINDHERATSKVNNLHNMGLITYGEWIKEIRDLHAMTEELLTENNLIDYKIK